MAVSVDILEKDVAIFAGLEATEQTAITNAAAAALFSTKAIFKVAEEVVKSDQRTVARPTAVINRQSLRYWEVDAEFPYAPSGTAGTANALAPIFLGSGAKQVITATTSVAYTRDSRAGFDSLTLDMRTPLDGVNFDYKYQAVGCRGQFGFSAEIGGELLLNFKGSGKFVQPARVAKVAPNFGAQLTNLFDIVKATNIAVKTINGKTVCLQKVSGDNCFSWAVKYMPSSCTALPDRAEPMDADSPGTMTFLMAMPDWNDAANSFNPYIIADRGAAPLTVPVAITLGTTAGKIVEITVAEAQFYEPTPTLLPNKTWGMSMKCDIIDGFAWTEK